MRNSTDISLARPCHAELTGMPVPPRNIHIVPGCLAHATRNQCAFLQKLSQVAGCGRLGRTAYFAVLLGCHSTEETIIACIQKLLQCLALARIEIVVDMYRYDFAAQLSIRSY